MNPMRHIILGAACLGLAAIALFNFLERRQSARPQPAITPSMWTLVENGDGLAIQVPTDDPRLKSAYVIYITDLYQMSHEDMRRILQAVVNEHNKSILNQ